MLRVFSSACLFAFVVELGDTDDIAAYVEILSCYYSSCSTERKCYPSLKKEKKDQAKKKNLAKKPSFSVKHVNPNS